MLIEPNHDLWPGAAALKHKQSHEGQKETIFFDFANCKERACNEYIYIYLFRFDFFLPYQ